LAEKLLACISRKRLIDTNVTQAVNETRMRFILDAAPLFREIKMPPTLHLGDLGTQSRRVRDGEAVVETCGEDGGSFVGPNAMAHPPDPDPDALTKRGQNERLSGAHRGQLTKISHEEYRNTAKDLTPSCHLAEAIVNVVEYLWPDEGDLVDDDEQWPLARATL
jgi:hypothetical protein